MKSQIPWLAYFLAIVNATIIGLSFMFTKIAVEQCSPFDTLAHRFNVGLTVFLVYSVIVRRLASNGNGIEEASIETQPRLSISFRGKPWLSLLSIILFYPIGFFTFQAFGLVYLPSAEAGIISVSAPILTTLLAAVFIKERTNLLQLLSIGLSISGVVYIAWMKGHMIDPTNIKGITLILLACLSTAGYTILNRVLVRSFSPWEITFVLMSGGFLFFNGMALGEHLLIKHQGIGESLAAMFAPLRNVTFTISILYLGIFASLLTTILSSLMLKRINSSQAVIFYNLSAIVSILAGWFFLNESIYLYHFIGTAIIIAGVIGTNYFSETGKAEATEKAAGK